MKFRTEIEPLDQQGMISHDSRIVTIGSCFSDTIGNRLHDCLFDVTVNPMGILFNPASIAAEVNRAVSGEKFVLQDAVMSPEQDKWVCFNRHSSFSAKEAETLVERLNLNLTETREALTEADIVMLTLGSARCFLHKQRGLVVANCHRFHPDTFAIEDLGIEEITRCLESAMTRLRAVNPAVKFILTVSPVRHASYGLAADRLSKSRLIVSAHELAATIPATVYFPAYEILTDDLRDYRFYESDLVHPTAMAADYVFDTFVNSFMKPELQGKLTSWRKIVRFADDSTFDESELIERARQLKATDRTISRIIARMAATKIRQS